MRQAPDEVVDKAKGVSTDVPLPSRWTLRTLRRSLDWLEGYSLSGVHRVLSRCGLRLRSGRVQQYSPDPEYKETGLTHFYYRFAYLKMQGVDCRQTNYGLHQVQCRW